MKVPAELSRFHTPNGIPTWLGSVFVPGLGQMAQFRVAFGLCVLAVTSLQYLLDWRMGLAVQGFFACEALIWHLYQKSALRHAAARRG